MFLFLTACTQQKIIRTNLYAVDSLVNAQVRYFSHHHATINKIASLGDKLNETSLRPIDTIAWKKELEILEALNVINKPVNKLRYRVELYADSKSNLNVKSFTTPDDLTVKYLRVFYHFRPEQIRKIEAGYNESNALYHSTRILTMDFEQIRDTSVLISYSILGGQKMFLDDSVQYNIRASLSFGN